MGNKKRVTLGDTFFKSVSDYQALSKSLFSNTDLHTEPVAAIQALGPLALQRWGSQLSNVPFHDNLHMSGSIPGHPGKLGSG